MSTALKSRAFVTSGAEPFAYSKRVHELLADIPFAESGSATEFSVNREIIFAPEFKQVIEKYTKTQEKLSACSICDSCISCDTSQTWSTYASPQRSESNVGCVNCNVICDVKQIF